MKLIPKFQTSGKIRGFNKNYEWTRVKRANGTYGYVKTRNGRAIEYSPNGYFRMYESPDSNSRSFEVTHADAKEGNTPSIQRTPDTHEAAVAKQKEIDEQVNQTTPDAGTLFNFATLGGMNNLSPIQWVRRGYDIATGQFDPNTWFFGNNGLVSDKYAKEHPYRAMAINTIGDIGTFGTVGALRKIPAWAKSNVVDYAKALEERPWNAVNGYVRPQIRRVDITTSEPLMGESLSPALKAKGWTLAEDGAMVNPQGQRFIRNSKGVLQSEESLKTANAVKAQKQLKEKALKAEEKRIKTIYDEFDKQGIKNMREEAWFQGRPKKEAGAITKEDYAAWRSHLPEYQELAKSLQKSGALRRTSTGTWEGQFSQGFKEVDPAEYIVANSKAFKKSGLHYDGVNRMNAMDNEAYNKMLQNGGLKRTTWTTDNPKQAEIFQKEKRPYLLKTLVSRYVKPLQMPTSQAREAGELSRGIDFAPNVNYRHTVGNYTRFGQDMQMKVLRGNNGNFDMNNKNIYKTLIPTILGGTFVGSITDNQ